MSGRADMQISDSALEHRVSIYVLIVVLVLGGIAAYQTLPREAAPEIEFPIILVNTPYFGVSPADIETLVTRPLEKELKEIKNIDELRSTSAESASIITIEFTTEANLDEALQEVREKVDLARPELPTDAEDPVIKAISASDFPVMIVNVSAPYSIVRLRDVAEDLQDEIETIQGVMEVKLAGGVEREIQVRVDPARLNHHGVSLNQVTEAISGENINMPGGDIDVGDATFLVRVPGEFTRVPEIERVPVVKRGDHVVYVRDLAEVRDSFKDRATISRLDGKNNVSLTITKRPGENILRIAEDIKSLIEDSQSIRPAGTEVVILQDASKEVKDMVKELENNILSGLILVVLVIFAVMGLRNSILVGLAIPMSMLVSFVAIALFDLTLNMIVLFSLILALGMLVDNAIVIVENIYRHASEDKSKLQAALIGTREVAWPVATSTLTTVAAFAPLLLWPGINGEFMGYLPMTLIITLVASLFVALIITPVLCSVFLRPSAQTTANSTTASISGAAGRFIRYYRTTLTTALRRPWLTLAIGVAAFFASVFLYGFSNLGVEFFPSVTPRKIFLDVDAGDGTRLETSDRIVKQVERVIGRAQNIKHAVANVGGGTGDNFLGGGGGVPHQSRISIDFSERADRTQPVESTIDFIRKHIANVPGGRIDVQKENVGPPTGAPVAIEIYGDDFDVLGRLSKMIRDRIESTDGLTDLRDDYQTGRPELRVEVDRDRAKLLGASTRQVAQTVRTAINGEKASNFRDGEDEYDITVRLAEGYRNTLSDIEALRVNVSSNKDPDARYLVPISAVARLKPSGGAGSIRHKDQKRVVTITANTEGRSTQEVLKDVKAVVDTLALPEGYALAYAGEDEEAKKDQAFLARAFLAALFLIALILVTQFNSVLLPATIMLSVLLSLVGVLWGQIITQMPFGIIMTGLGVISLAGVVVNNGIVLVDYIQQLRARGIPRNEAIVQAGLVRLRPVLLTAVTTVLGLLPMAFGVSIDFSSLSPQVGGQTADFWRPMAVAVIFGLLIATVLTLVVVPVLYRVFDDLEDTVTRAFQRTQTTPSTAPPASGS